jgi:hypothetical protein
MKLDWRSAAIVMVAASALFVAACDDDDDNVTNPPAAGSPSPTPEPTPTPTPTPSPSPTAEPGIAIGQQVVIRGVVRANDGTTITVSGNQILTDANTVVVNAGGQSMAVSGLAIGTFVRVHATQVDEFTLLAQRIAVEPPSS